MLHNVHHLIFDNILDLIHLLESKPIPTKELHNKLDHFHHHSRFQNFVLLRDTVYPIERQNRGEDFHVISVRNHGVMIDSHKLLKEGIRNYSALWSHVAHQHLLSLSLVEMDYFQSWNLVGY
jgi:hypothetical protein